MSGTNCRGRLPSAHDCKFLEQNDMGRDILSQYVIPMFLQYDVRCTSLGMNDRERKGVESGGSKSKVRAYRAYKLEFYSGRWEGKTGFEPRPLISAPKLLLLPKC